jgi:endoglucanase
MAALLPISRSPSAPRRWLGCAILMAAWVMVGCASGSDEEEGIATPDLTTPAEVASPTVGDDVASVTSVPDVVIEGTRFVDQDGAPLRLLGLNRAGTEYACAQGWGIFDGASDAAIVGRMQSWGVNAMRVPLNEHCWLGINGVTTEFGGLLYQRAVLDWIDLLHDAGMVAVLPLMWSDAGDEVALSQERMANRDHSERFWVDVAETFGDEPGIVFELYGEPHDISWDCWELGCDDADGFPVASMQSLVDAVRSTGSTTPILVNGLRYANDVSELLERMPTDPAGQMGVGFHLYNFNACNDAGCWDRELGPVVEQFPLFVTEVGEDTCDGSFVNEFFDWADPKGVSYLAWTWNAWGDCAAGPTLIENEDGTPTPYGAVVRDHLIEQSGA